MKKIFALLAAFASLTSCSVKDLTEPESSADSPILHASFEDEADATKTYVDNSLHLFWTADDMLSVFLGTTYNQQYRFLGETGDRSGDFEEVTPSGTRTGSGVEAIYAVYPYQPAAGLSADGAVTVELPSVQQYAPGSFGPGTNTMVAVTAGKADTFLSFKNLCGYLVVKLYGNGTVKSVTIEGNSGEKLAGKATVTASHTAAPTLVLADDATTSITIDCGEGATLGSTAEAATEFWFCIPPVTFSKGFTITATGSAGSFSKSTTSSRTVERNVRVSMPALEFVPDGPAEPEAVDLGLPSGIKWASFNLGATKPEEYGGYYQWGGLQDVTSTSFYLSYDNCPFHTGLDAYSGWTKYIPWDKSSFWSGEGSPDNKTFLDQEDDVAHVMLGGSWRMPTEAEINELIDNCQSDWVIYKGVYGRKFTSKIAGYTENWIFLPAAGSRDHDSPSNTGSHGCYWYSSLNEERPHFAYEFDISSHHVLTDYYSRRYGLSVRPVSDKDAVHVTGISLNKSSITLVAGNSESLATIFSPSNAHNQNVIWSSNNTDIAAVTTTGLVMTSRSGTATITAKSQDGGYTATCTVTVTDYAMPESVDLGLPSGIKWASCNIGANCPEEYGDYYAWGETETKQTFSKENYKFYKIEKGTNSNSFEVEYKGYTKYVPRPIVSIGFRGFYDDKIFLDQEDDVAHVTLGGSWRMPTEAEINELIDNCQSDWVIYKGVYGRKFTSKKAGYPENWIFLPAAGCLNSDGLGGVDSRGYYWSSSLYQADPADARYMSFHSGEVFTRNDYRYYGRSVRPVNDESTVHVSDVSLNKSAIVLGEGSYCTLSVTISPENAHNRNLAWTSSNPDIATVDEEGFVMAIKSGEAKITVMSQDGGHTATCSVTVSSAGPSGPEAVDLGLSVKWASFNLGASKPEEYGGYYQWAGLQDVTDKSIYLNYRNCPYHTGSSSSTGWTKYIPTDFSYCWSGTGSPDNKTVLDPEDDVVHVKLGGNWRMPTKEEFDELIDNSTIEWTTLNGVSGGKFTSKKNGKSIFLPVAGMRENNTLYYNHTSYYWSASLYTDNPIMAYGVHFYSDYVYTDCYYWRCQGLSVRPVCEVASAGGPGSGEDIGYEDWN